jgi:hypothetical protein
MTPFSPIAGDVWPGCAGGARDDLGEPCRVHARQARCAAGFPVGSVSEQGAPAGVRFATEKNSQATISGIPAKSTRGKRYVIRFTARNGVGNAVVQRFTLRVS